MASVNQERLIHRRIVLRIASEELLDVLPRSCPSRDRPVQNPRQVLGKPKSYPALERDARQYAGPVQGRHRANQRDGANALRRAAEPVNENETALGLVCCRTSGVLA